MRIEDINWCKEFLDFGFAFLATACGVFLAFELDRWRERKNIREKKIKLIQSLVEELEYVVDFTHKNPSLQLFNNYHLQTDVIEETIEGQLEYFDLKTNKLLKHIRKILIVEGEALAEWAELNKEAVGTGNYPNQHAAYNAGNIRTGWNTFTINISSMIVELKKELERERVEP